MEIWKDVVGYEGIYKISNKGRLKSLNYQHTGKEKVRTCNVKGNNYVSVILCKGAGESYTRKSLRIHRLVAIAFLPNPENKPVVNHINGIKNDNNLKNLEWCTCSENELHAHRTGLKVSPMKGKEGHNKRAVKMYSKEGIFIKEFDSATNAAKEINALSCNVTRTCQGIAKSCKGYLFEYS
jgi:hypothetical protein